MIINLTFAGFIILIILYSFLFSAEGHKHPVPSAGKWLTSQTLPSTGLSRSFSEIVRLDFRQAREYNPYGTRIFSFFILQFILRLIGSLLALRTESNNLRALVFSDIVCSACLFFLCFWPFFLFPVRQLIH